MRRAALAAAFLGVVPIAHAGAASAPTITLLAPADGATVVSSSAHHPTFSWKIDWAEPEQGMVVWQIAADPAFNDNAETVTQFCPATNVDCWTSVTPQEVWSPPRGHTWYWRVGFSTGAGTTYSRTWSFGAYDTAGADRQAPRVLALTGAGKHGRRAVFRARLADDRLFVRVHVSLSRGSRVRFGAAFSVSNSRWTLPVQLRTRAPLPRRLRGTYAMCVQAVDRAGNAARSCARYFVR